MLDCVDFLLYEFNSWHVDEKPCLNRFGFMGCPTNLCKHCVSTWSKTGSNQLLIPQTQNSPQSGKFQDYSNSLKTPKNLNQLTLKQLVGGSSPPWPKVLNTMPVRL
jgi:hypothetical protein